MTYHLNFFNIVLEKAVRSAEIKSTNKERSQTGASFYRYHGPDGRHNLKHKIHFQQNPRKKPTGQVG